MHVSVKELPPVVRDWLKSNGFGKQDIAIDVKETVCLQDMGCTGRRGFTAMIDLATGESSVTRGSWGGPNAYCLDNTVDTNDRDHPLPVGVVCVQGSEGYKGVRADIVVHPQTMNMAALPAPQSLELTKQEQAVINIVDSCTSSGRAREFEYDAALGKYGPENPHIVSLVAKGLLKISGGKAISITTEGKNARKR